MFAGDLTHRDKGLGLHRSPLTAAVRLCVVARHLPRTADPHKVVHGLAEERTRSPRAASESFPSES